jgi:hypothetical protein
VTKSLIVRGVAKKAVAKSIKVDEPADRGRMIHLYLFTWKYITAEGAPILVGADSGGFLGFRLGGPAHARPSEGGDYPGTLLLFRHVAAARIERA